MKMRLNRSELGILIRESVKRIMNELDLTKAPLFHDSRERDAWWREQILADFPEYSGWLKNVKYDFKDLYYRIRDEKKRREEEKAKKEERSRYMDVVRCILEGGYIKKVPVYLKRDGKKWASIEGTCDAVHKEKAFLNIGWKLHVRGLPKGKKADVALKASVYVYPSKNKIYFEVNKTNSKSLDDYMCTVFIGEYLNKFIKKNYDIIANEGGDVSDVE